MSTLLTATAQADTASGHRVLTVSLFLAFVAVTLTITVPETLGEEAAAALRAYAEAERAAGFDPRAGWAGV